MDVELLPFNNIIKVINSTENTKYFTEIWKLYVKKKSTKKIPDKNTSCKLIFFLKEKGHLRKLKRKVIGTETNRWYEYQSQLFK